MPELPEVETIRRGLKKEILNRRIIKIQVNLPKLIRIPKANQFKARLKDTMIEDIRRQGKFILFFLHTGDRLVVHLGMSGLLLYQENELIIPQSNKKHHHIIFYFQDGSKLIYNDVRQFGKIWLLEKNDELAEIKALGFEPLGYYFTFDEFYRMLQKSRKNIKSFLMNQKNVAGIGNIYANEILFHSGIHPLRKANSLQIDETRTVYQNIRKILSRAIALRGTTMIDESYRDHKGNKGQYMDDIMIYGKRGGTCPICGRHIEIIRIENRSTFVCPVCQI